MESKVEMSSWLPHLNIKTGSGKRDSFEAELINCQAFNFWMNYIAENICLSRQAESAQSIRLGFSRQL